MDTFNVNGGTTNYIYGGVGNDVIVIGKTSTGTAVVKDFSVKSGNKDTVKVTGGAVKSIAVSGKNMIVKGGKSAAVTLQNVKSKTFTVTDTLGTYTVAGANVKLALGKNYKGTLNVASFITTVDGRSDANAIILEIDEDNTGNGILAFNTTNNGVTLDEKGIATKFAFEKDGWRYLFNVNIVDPDTYERYQGISEVNVAPKANVIFDLMGRQLTKAGKGLYIMNGKKVLVK